MRALLIDEDVELTEMLTGYLTGEGFRASTVHGGDAGVKAVLSDNPAAVVLDRRVPGKGGLDVLRRIRRCSSMPVIMLGAKGDPVDHVISLEMGADD